MQLELNRDYKHQYHAYLFVFYEETIYPVTRKNDPKILCIVISSIRIII